MKWEGGIAGGYDGYELYSFLKGEADTISAKALRCMCLAWLRMSKESSGAGER